MDEAKNRKYERKDFGVQMFVDSVFKQDNEVVNDLDAVIEVFNISRGGVGFYSKSDMPIGYYFNVEIVFNGEKHFKTVLKILRKEKIEDRFEYGSEFVGLADNLANLVDELL